MKVTTSTYVFFPSILLLLFTSLLTFVSAEVRTTADQQPQRNTVNTQPATIEQSNSLESSDNQEDRAAAGDQIGEILKTHTCPIHGYHLIIARPAGYPAGASERVIQVEKTNRFFNATWNEVDNLISNYPPNELEYNQLSQNPGPSGERYCNRDGHMIPTDTNVYQVSLAHYNDYTGQTSIFADNNLETAPLISVLHAYNQHRVFGDELPPTCNYGCLDGNSGGPSGTDPWGDINFGEINFGGNDPRKPWENIHDEDSPGVGGQGGIVADTARADTRAADSYFEGDQQGTNTPLARQDEEDIDTVDPDDIAPAQDYNSTRSNRRKNEFFNPEDDAEDDESGVPTVSAERLATIANNPPNVRCGAIAARGDDNGTLWCWGSGVRAAAVGDGNEDGTLATSTRVLQHLTIQGNKVRAWNAQERAEFARYRELMQEQNTPEVRTAAIAHLVLENDRIQNLEISGQESQVTYRTQLRLLGFIPIEREVTVYSSTDGDISISYPWYSFFSTKPEESTLRDLLQTVTAIAHT